MRQWKIGPAQVEQAAQIGQIHRQCFSQPWTDSAIAEEIAKQNSCFLTAVSSNTVIGFGNFSFILDEGYIGNIGVQEAFRKQGVAKSILLGLLQQAKAEKLSFLTLEVRPSNRAAISLYEGAGFTAVGRRKNFYQFPREDALLYTCIINEKHKEI